MNGFRKGAAAPSILLSWCVGGATLLLLKEWRAANTRDNLVVLRRCCSSSGPGLKKSRADKACEMGLRRLAMAPQSGGCGRRAAIVPRRGGASVPQTNTNQSTNNKQKETITSSNKPPQQFNKQTLWCCGCGVLLCCRGLREVGATEQGGACEGCPRHAGKRRGRRCRHS